MVSRPLVVSLSMLLSLAASSTFAAQGPSSSAGAYLKPIAPGVSATSIITTGDSVGGYRMAGIPDGLGAFDNNDGTFTVLMNQELGFAVGATRDHGAIGAFVSKWVIDKSTLQVLSGSDLMKNVYDWNTSTQASNSSTTAIAFNRFCSADLAPTTGLYNPVSGNGTQARIFMNGEESDGFGKPLAHVVTGPDARSSYVLGKFNLGTDGTGSTFTASANVTSASTGSNVVTLASTPFSLNIGQSFLGSTIASVSPGTNTVTLTGNANANIGASTPANYTGPVTAAWENLLVHPNQGNILGDKTVVIGDSDGGTGIMNNTVAVYVGTKKNTGTEADKAGLTNGVVKFVNVTGFADNNGTTNNEISNTTTRTTAIANGTAFTLSNTASTTFSRPEDGAWSPKNPNQYFFVTTDQLDKNDLKSPANNQSGGTRLWRLTFTDITNPDLGGTIDKLIDSTAITAATGPSSGRPDMFDNITVNKDGTITLLEDVGNADHNGKVWLFDPSTNSLTKIFGHDPALFGELDATGALIPGTHTKDEETSGVIDITDLLGRNDGRIYNLITVQDHASAASLGLSNPSELVEGGQLLLLSIPEPTSLGLVALGATALLARRRRSA